jgi:hypothetical protein
MPCRSPLTSYRDCCGKITFDPKQAAGYSGNSFGTVRCGMCRDCRLHRAREWAIRCHHEASLHPRNSFLTLTFENDPGSISKRDLQLFFKRLRKALPGKRIRYFACGEYGEKLGRPHYHVCLFGYDFPDKYPWVKSPKGNLQYRSPLLENAWSEGHALIGELTMESAGYTARYALKKITGSVETDHYTREFLGTTINVTPEFQLQSLKPAIGLGWIEKHWREVAQGNSVIYKGKECPIPRYYNNWIKDHHPDAYKTMQKTWEAHRKGLEYESGVRMHLAAQARDSRTRNLRRALEEQSDD